MARWFESEYRVYYADTDAGGIVYHAQYLLYAERARSDLLRHLSLSLVTEDGDQFVVTRANVAWHSSAKLDDLVQCRTCVESIGGARVAMTQNFFVKDRPITSVEVHLAFVSANHRPRRLTQTHRDRLAGFLSPRSAMLTGKT